MTTVGQDRVYTPCMTVYLVIFLPRIPCMHCICIVLANPTNAYDWPGPPSVSTPFLFGFWQVRLSLCMVVYTNTRWPWCSSGYVTVLPNKLPNAAAVVDVVCRAKRLVHATGVMK